MKTLKQIITIAKKMRKDQPGRFDKWTDYVREASKQTGGLSGVKRSRRMGAPGDYAKYEIAVIKKLAKLLKQPYKKTAETINLDNNLLNIISKNFDNKVSINETAKELKTELIRKTQKATTPLQAFVDILKKLPKKDQPKKYTLPLKFPASVTIGKVKKKKPVISKHKDINSHNVRLTIMSGIDKNDILNRIERLIKYNKEIEQYIEKQKYRIKTDKSSTFNLLQKKIVLTSIKRYKELLSANKKYLNQLKKQL